MQEKNDRKVTFSEALKKLMQERKTKSVELARILGLSHAAINFYRSGKNLPDLGIAADIARFFSVPIESLLGIPSPDLDPRCEQLDEVKSMREMATALRQDIDGMKRLLASAEHRLKKF